MIIRADARHIPLADGSVQCVVTSPPYWGLRDYGTAKWDGGDVDHQHGAPYEAGQSTNKGNSTTHAGRFLDCPCGARRIDAQIGLEPTPEAYVATMVRVFREVWRVLRDDGTLWLNLGDSYCKDLRHSLEGIKHKDLCGIPWRVAFALQADGWYLRSDIIWAKPNPMPESVTDRPTRSHEYLFLLAKSERYYYDAEAIKERGSEVSVKRINQVSFDSQNGGAKDGSNRSARRMLVNLKDKQRGHSRRHDGFNDRWDSMSHEEQCSMMVNKRDVWNIACEPTPEPHFATFPQKLIEPCILAGSRLGDMCLDPFLGSGTVGKVCERFGRRWAGLELSADYISIAKQRTAQRGLFV